MEYTFGDLEKGFNIHGDLTGLVFADAGAAFVDLVRQLLESHAPGLAEGADAAARVQGDLTHHPFPLFRINIHFSVFITDGMQKSV